MARFYFHFSNDQEWVHDNEGRDCTLDEVAELAATEARWLLAHDVLSVRPVALRSCIAVANANGDEVYRVTYRDILDLH